MSRTNIDIDDAACQAIYRFDNAMVQKVMNLLRRSTDPTTAAEVENLLQQSMTTPATEKSSGAFWPIAAAVIVAAVAVTIFLMRR